MPDYSKGKIYKIISNSTKFFYIGSTTQTLSLRLSKHKNNSKKNPNTKVYQAFNDIGWDDLRIVKIADYPECESKEDLTQKEQEHIEELNNEWCLNSFKAWTGLCKKDYLASYYQENREKILNKVKQYREDNREELNEKKREYHNENKDRINERRRELWNEADSKMKQTAKAYRSTEEFKEKKRKIDKEYRDANKEELYKKASEKVLCICCNTLYRKSDRGQHEKTKTHIINFIEY